MDNLCIYDIFEEIIKYLDPISIQNLINSSKKLNNLYYYNHSFINKIFIIKIFDFFNLWKNHKGNDLKLKKKQDYINCLDKYELNCLKKHACNIYKYFYNHPDSNISDIIIYHIENVYRYEPNTLLKYLVSLCDKKIYSIDDTCKYKLHTNDIIYILTYANYFDFCILLEHFEIRPNMISYIIKEILVQKKKNNSNIKDCEEKIFKSLEFYFYKYFFGKCVTNTTFNLFLNHILLMLLQYNENEFVNFVLAKKRTYQNNVNIIELNYQTLITTAITNNNINILEILWSEYTYHDNLSTDDKILIITPEIITIICKNGWFDIFKWVVEIILCETINLKGYISAILDGLFMYIYTINDNEKFKNLSDLIFLKNYFSIYNKNLFNEQMNILYKTNRTTNQIHFLELN